jgi:formate-dependent nitrite reductase membrane component NrfD
MTTLAAEVQHFAGSPAWTWYILFYFFFAGLSGGSYFIATLFRLRGEPSDLPVARLGYYVAFLTLLVCPALLILDLGTPLRFWHMMWNTTPGGAGLNFKYWSPMSVGVWALTVYGLFATVSFLEALAGDLRSKRLLHGAAGKAFLVAGAIVALFIAGYTGVLLSVSNQPVWSDTWALGGLFLASGLSGSAALLLFLVRYRPAAQPSARPLSTAERLYAILELALIVIFAVTLLWAGALDTALAFPWTLLWLVALIGLLPGIGGLPAGRRAVTAEGVTVPARPASATKSVAIPVLVLLGVLALRAAVIFGAQ